MLIILFAFLIIWEEGKCHFPSRFLSLYYFSPFTPALWVRAHLTFSYFSVILALLCAPSVGAQWGLFFPPVRLHSVLPFLMLLRPGDPSGVPVTAQGGRGGILQGRPESSVRAQGHWLQGQGRPGCFPGQGPPCMICGSPGQCPLIAGPKGKARVAARALAGTNHC